MMKYQIMFLVCWHLAYSMSTVANCVMSSMLRESALLIIEYWLLSVYH